MAVKHIANRENLAIALNINPDFCQVGDDVIPFDIARTLDHEKTLYAKTVYARGEPVVLRSTIASGVIGNAGRGIKSEVSRAEGHVEIIEDGPFTVFAEGRPVIRHLDECWMNAQVDPVPLREEDIKDATP